MKCPIDGSELVISQRQGVEIDYCPKCRGVWLDRGELDKILEREGQYYAPSVGSGKLEYDSDDNYRPAPGYEREGRPHSYDDEYHKQQPKKKRGFLDDIFDFG